MATPGGLINWKQKQFANICLFYRNVFFHGQSIIVLQYSGGAGDIGDRTISIFTIESH